VRVLIVDDSERLRQALRSGLDSMGLAVDVAADGQAALAFLDAGHYDVIVLDLLMPRLDGREVLRQIRRRGLDTRVLVLSALDGVEERVGRLDDGADDYLVKPFSFEELRARVLALGRRRHEQPVPVLDHHGLRLDTARRSASGPRGPIELGPKEYALLEVLVDAAEAQQVAGHPALDSAPAWLRGIAGIGATAERGLHSLLDLAGFVGQILETWLRIAPYPRRWRLTAVVAQIQRVAVDAVPIVALLSFMVGTVVAFLGATVLANFGASIFAVHLVAFSFMREFGVLLPAILIAGRTASAYTAQIGSMKANEEIDALRSGGLNPIELLVLPRVLALLVSLPLLTLVGVLAGIAGGAAVCVLSLDISLAQFLAIVQDKIEVRHFLVGLSKAPFFAVMIAAIGCHEGFKVSGSAQSVGDHTTSSVVQSIFVVILLDALAALFFMEMGW